MIIIRFSSGLANAIMEFCTGYALSREIGDEKIALDIGECQDNAWGFLLDMLNIPIYEKISYYTVNAMEFGLTNVFGLPQDLSKERLVITDKSEYPGLKEARRLKRSNRDIILSGLFFDPFEYYMKYWNELIPMISYRGDSENISGFLNLIKGKESVAIHFRRGDMLYADFAEDTIDDYYKAAIEYVKLNIDKNALFCVFSDDIKYAEELLGYDENIKYIHFLGFDDVDVEEFFCISLCDHRILPSGSTFSELADRICNNANKKAICQGNCEEKKANYLGKLLKKIRIVKGRVLTYFFKDKFQTARRYLKVFDYYKHRIHLDGYDIIRYSKRFEKVCDNREHSEMNDVLSLKISGENARGILESIRKYELSYRSLAKHTEMTIRYKKMMCHFLLGEYEKAIAQADYIWGWMIHENEFQNKYALLLHILNIERESRLIGRGTEKSVCVVFINHFPSCYSCRIIGMGELAVGFAKMGYEVHIVEKPVDKTEREYITSHRYLVTRHETSLGCRQYMYDEVLKYGFSHFLETIKAKTKEQTVIVITRDELVLSKKVSGMCYISMDNSDDSDPERFFNNEGNNVDSLIEKCDYLITCKDGQYNQNERKKLIVYKRDYTQTPFFRTTDRWKQHNCHRLSERTLSVCEAFDNWCGKKYMQTKSE